MFSVKSILSFNSASALPTMLAISIALHLGLLTVRFVNPQAFDRIFEDSPLEVILVNAKSDDKPDIKAQALAQSSLAGGGDLEQKIRATSPLPSATLDSIGDSLEENQKHIEALEEQQAQMLTSLHEQLSKLPTPEPKEHKELLSPDRETQEQKRQQLINLLAEIERRVNEQNSRPKKRYISPSTRQVSFALYYDSLRTKIERRGTANFPEHNGKKLFGRLIMTLEVDARGQLISSKIEQSSGNPVLDRRALAIAQTAAPFGDFTDEMKKEAGILVIPTLFSFTEDETLEANFRQQLEK